MEQVNRIPVADPDITDGDMEEIMRTVRAGWVSAISPVVSEFEQLFAEKHDCKYGVATSSGTTALHLALATLGIGKGDEVIVPDFTMVATANAVRYCGAEPVFVDVERESWCIDPDLVEKAVSLGQFGSPRTKAIIPVHLYGCPADMDRICEIAERYDIAIIEDCAQAHGATYRGRKVGSFGDFGAFSLYPNKIVTAGEGGILVTNDAKLAERAQWLKAHCFGSKAHYYHDEMGYNYRMSGLQAALGLSQTRRLEKYVNHHIDCQIQYRQELWPLERELKIRHQPHQPFPTSIKMQYDTRAVFWMFTPLIELGFGMDVPTLIKKLDEKGIESRPSFYPLHALPFYADRGCYIHGEGKSVTWELYEKAISLPSGNTLTPQQITRVCDAVKDLAK